MRALKGLILALLVPGLLFCAVASARRGVCLQSYDWSASEGYVPVPKDCALDERAGFLSAAGFYTRAIGGLATGRGGRSREDASRPLSDLVVRRGKRSLGIIVVACLVLLGIASLTTGAGWLKAQILARLRQPTLLKLLHGLPTFSSPGGLPLPLAGLLVFILVVRIVPAGSRMDYDTAGVFWAGLALALADGVGAVLFRGLRHTLGIERSKPYAEALNLWGGRPERAIAHVSRRVRASQVRGAVLALLGGLLVVEGVFSVNGLGETLRDLVVDRRGLDPLLLCAVLVCFSLFVLLVEWLPLERALGRRP
jgi:ABC-type dipeptide/oligopeptide/nickel transport system permease component